MKPTNEDIDRLTITEPTKNLEEYTKYGGFGDSRIADDDVFEYKEFMKEQMVASLEEINRLRSEVPIAIHFLGKKFDKDTIRVG